MALLIPPVPSMEGEEYSFIPMCIPMLVFLIASRALAILREEETWLGLIMKAALFTALGFAINFRVFF
ncbi:MAG: hypothetical protein SGJ20_00360 [Planctomycetota bacterium]|nr:hypothetical protein [Planctomycetota bacterium]